MNRKNFNVLNVIIIIAPIILLLTIILNIIYKPQLDNDVAQYLTAGQMMLNGSIPYKDLVDTNFPMIIYLSYFPALISKLLNFHLVWSGILFFLILYLSVGLLIIRLLKIIFKDLNEFGIVLFIMVWLINLLIVYQHNQFGQRDFLIIIFFIPYLLLRFSRYIGMNISKNLMFLTAFLSFIALSIKPHYVLFYLVIEILLILSYGFRFRLIFRLEITLLTFLLFIYGIHLFLVPGISSSFNYWIRVISEGYSVYNNALSEILKHLINKYSFLLVFSIFIAFFTFSKSSRYFYLAGCFGWISFSAVIVYFLQSKGWSYHLLPFFLSNFLSLFFLIMGLTKRLKNRESVFMSVPIILLLIYSLYSFSKLVNETGLKNAFSFSKNEFSEVIIAMSELDDNVLFLDTSVFPGFPATTLTERKIGSRFLNTFPIAFIFGNSKNYAVPEKWQSFENDFYNMLISDISQNKPKLIFINTSDYPQATSENFQISKYLELRGFYDFLKADYIKFQSVKSFEVYKLD